MKTPPCPVIEKALLDYLEAVFPGKIPDHEISLHGYGVLRGEQRVLEALRGRYRDQNRKTSPDVLQQT